MTGLCSCSSSDSEAPAGAAEATPDAGVDTSSGGSGGSAPEGGAGNAGAAGEAGGGGAAGNAQDAAAEAAAPVTSCTEIAGSKDCFANKDCPAERRCQNAGTDSVPVPCCVVGQRGSGVAGAACTGELDCESGVCIAGAGPYLCSKDCASAADCPDNMKDCKAIAFSGSADNWCFPTQ